MSLKILVVDDEPAVCKLLKSILEALGIETLALTDSREAARRVESEKFDGIVLDARMPHMDGFELTRHVRTHPTNRDAPVVMITASDDIATMRQAFRAGISFFLGKPFTQDKVYGLFRVARGPMLREKRRHARLPYRTAVTCTFREQKYTVTSLNVCEGGMALESAAGAPVGEILELEFRLAGFPEPLRLRGKVIRKGPPDRTAVQFLDLPESDREALQDFIAGKVKG
jgi:CheY-like chemotaxis protein